MKEGKKVNVIKHVLVPAETAPNGAKLIKQVVAAYLHSMKAPASRKQYLNSVSSGLSLLISKLGDVPMESVTSDMVRTAVLRYKQRRSSQEFVMARMKGFFNWSRANGYVPRYLSVPDRLTFWTMRPTDLV